jgi:hypothetical protein
VLGGNAGQNQNEQESGGQERGGERFAEIGEGFVGGDFHEILFEREFGTVKLEGAEFTVLPDAGKVCYLKAKQVAAQSSAIQQQGKVNL